jgi:hypothetical protein
VQGEPPKWALELASRASRVLSCAPPVEISWRETRYTRSSGCYWKERKRIHVSAGTDRRDQRYVVLHEVAHHMLSQNGKDTGRSHGPDFWSACLILCRKFRVPAHHLRRRHRSRTLRRILG